MNSVEPIHPYQYVDDRPQEGIFRIHKNAYSDPKVFELEIEHIFNKTWSFLGLTSQIPKAHDWISTYIARSPILITRDGSDEIRAFINACRHKGSKLTRTEKGNNKYHSCPYHGWVYSSNGKLADIKDKEHAQYAEAFDFDSHDLLPIGKIAVYKGLIFGSLNPNVPALEDFLGELKYFIDLAMDQGEQGMEFIPGNIEFAYEGNWKLQLENGTDAYHLTSTHVGFLDLMAKRAVGQGNIEARQFDWQKRFSQHGGDFHFDHGHTLIWLNQAEVKKRPIYPSIEAITQRLGKDRAEWMLKMRNMSIFPNLQIADSTSLLMRTFRPLSVNLTELRYWCLAPIGEPADQRAWRLRQFEDFFNVSGLATPDDTVTYETCQSGFESSKLDWLQGHARGMMSVQEGASETAKVLGFSPKASLDGGFMVQSETSFHPLYREWARMMKAGMHGSKTYE